MRIGPDQSPFQAFPACCIGCLDKQLEVLPSKSRSSGVAVAGRGAAESRSHDVRQPSRLWSAVIDSGVRVIRVAPGGDVGQGRRPRVARFAHPAGAGPGASTRRRDRDGHAARYGVHDLGGPRGAFAEAGKLQVPRSASVAAALEIPGQPSSPVRSSSRAFTVATPRVAVRGTSLSPRPPVRMGWGQREEIEDREVGEMGKRSQHLGKGAQGCRPTLWHQTTPSSTRHASAARLSPAYEVVGIIGPMTG